MPLITNRSMLVQVTFDMGSGFTPRTMEGRLLLRKGSSAAPQAYTVSKAPTSGAIDRLDGAMSFIVPADAVAANSELALELREAAAAPGTGKLVTRFPVGNTMQALQPWPDAMPLRMVVVPVRTVGCSDQKTYEAPRFDESLRNLITNNVYNLVPTNDLQIVFHPNTITPTGCDDGDLMSRLADLARAEKRGPEWYYQGHLVQNIGGFGLVPGTADGGGRLSWVGYWPGGVPVNVVHELGHNLGSLHTFDRESGFVPAAARDYGGRAHYGFALRGGPHPWWRGSDIGQRIIPPTTRASVSDVFNPNDKNFGRIDNGTDNNFFDVMSYTQLYWVGAGNYKAWAQRIRDSNALRSAAGRAGRLDATDSETPPAAGSERLIAIYINRAGQASWTSEAGELPPRDRRAAALLIDGVRHEVQVHVTTDGWGRPGLIRVDPGRTLAWRGHTVELQLDGQSYSHRP